MHSQANAKQTRNCPSKGRLANGGAADGEEKECARDGRLVFMQHKQISKIHGWETKETCKIVCVCTIYANLNTHKTSRNVGIYKYLVKVQDQGRK